MTALRPRHGWWWGLAAAALLGVAAAATWQGSRGRAAAPVYGRIPDFSLTDQRGRPVTLADLRGAPWIADFIFTRCGGQCPMMTARMRAIQERLPPGSPMRLVSISVDPAHDTPEVLAGYAAAAGAGARWLFLTGPQERIFRLSREGFHLGAAPTGDSPEEPVIHSVRLVLVDGERRIRGYYDGTEAGVVDRLVHDASTLR